MRAGVASTLQQTLTPEAATVLNRAAALAARHNHAQVTPLHVASSLLSSPCGMLQQACLQSHRHLHHPLQSRALELCFNVALERLPSAPSGGGGESQSPSPSPSPPLSNALVAALKRAQAHQRRGCPEQQQVPLLAIRVEMEQLVISILDDPSVSRVMREAGFSSTKAKNSLEAIAAAAAAAAAASSPLIAPPPLGGSPRAPPVFSLAKSSAPAAEDHAKFKLNSRANLLARGLEPYISRDLDAALAILCSSRRRRSPVLVGDESATGRVLAELLSRVGDGGGGGVPPPLRGARIVGATDKLEAMAALKVLEESVASSRQPLLACLGDISWCLEPSAAAVMLELARIADVGRSCVWYLGIASSHTYTRFLAQHPSMEGSLGLQPLPISSSTLRPRFSHVEKDDTPPMLHTRLPKMPFKILEEPATVSTDFCADCNAKFEQESLQFQEQAGLAESVQSSSGDSLPFWLKNGRPSKAPQQLRPQSHEQLLEMRKKWSRICHILHSTSRSTCSLSLPNLLNDSTSSSSQTSSPEGKVENDVQPPKSSMSWLSLSTPPPAKSRCLETEPGLSLGLSPSKSVVTDLSLTISRLHTDSLVQHRDSMVSNTTEEVTNFKRLNAGLSERVPWQVEAVGKVASTVTQCRVDSERRRQGVAVKGDVWLVFSGPDRIGKRKVAKGLAELVFGSKNVISMVSLSKKRMPAWAGEEATSRGKTVVDRVADVLSRTRGFCVLVLEDFDEAESSLRKSVLKAMERGKLADTSGREVSLGNAIVVLTFSDCSGGVEDRLLGVEPCDMRLQQVSDGLVTTAGVSIVEFTASGVKEKLAAVEESNFVTGKRRARRWSEAFGSLLKHRHKAASVDLSLGLSCGGEVENCSSHGVQSLGDSALSLVDRVVEFQEVDFDEMAEAAIEAVEAVAMENGTGRLEVDVRCLEAMVAALWDDRDGFHKWLRSSLGEAFARRRGLEILQLRKDGAARCSQRLLGGVNAL